MKRYALLMLLALGLSACTIRFDIGVDVNEDESGTFTVFMGLDEEMRELMEQSGGEDMSITDQLASDAPEGFEVEEYAEDGFEGVLLSTSFTSFDDLNTKLTETADEGSPTDMVNSFEFTHEDDEFRFSADVSGLGEGFTDAVGEAGGEDMLSGFDPSFMSDLFEIRFQLTLPGEITEHNADSIDGSTVTWDLAFDESRDALVAVSSTSGGNSFLLIGGAVIVVAAAAGIGVAASRRRKKSSVDAVTSAAASGDAPPVDPIS